MRYKMRARLASSGPARGSDEAPSGRVHAADYNYRTRALPVAAFFHAVVLSRSSLEVRQTEEWPSSHVLPSALTMEELTTSSLLDSPLASTPHPLHESPLGSPRPAELRQAVSPLKMRTATPEEEDESLGLLRLRALARAGRWADLAADVALQLRDAALRSTEVRPTSSDALCSASASPPATLRRRSFLGSPTRRLLPPSCASGAAAPTRCVAQRRCLCRVAALPALLSLPHPPLLRCTCSARN